MAGRLDFWRELSWRRRIALVVGGGFLLALLMGAVGYAVTDVPPPKDIATNQALRLMYSDGKTEMGRFGTNRVLVRLNQVSPEAQHAILAAEDRDFYSEPGISPKGIGRALFSNVRGGGVQQGGSTITQQYAKNAFLTQERTYTRKVKEVFIALKMSRTVSKDQILEDYLNTIYFGRGAFGIEVASTTYFGKHAAQLTASEAAVLASSIRSPAGYDPERHPERAKSRWAYVLDGMVTKRWLEQDARAAAVYPKVRKREESTSLPGDIAHIRDRVVEDLEAHGFTEDRIANGGLTVRTTLDAKAQKAARRAVEERVPAGKKPSDPVGALVSIEARTGRVVAYYGGRTAGGFDFAGGDKGVQPGSSMKPYVLAAALEEGKHLSDRYDGHSPQEVCGDTVRNDEGDPPLGQVDLATGLALSVNTVYTRLACDVGPKDVVRLAKASGITTPLDGEGAVSQQVALGSGGYEVTPFDQALGYATFAAQGERPTPFFVASVRDRDGNEVFKAKKEKDRVFSEDTAADATFAMQKVVNDGTGSNAKIPGRPTAGKTGTTQENRNAWFCGFTPQLATVVWVGRPDGKPMQGQLGVSGGVYGGTVPAKVFRDYMETALEGQPVEQFPKPTGRTGNPTGTPTATATATGTPTPTATAIPTVTAVPSQSAPPSLPPVVPSATKEPKPTQSPDSSPPPPTTQPSAAASP